MNEPAPGGSDHQQSKRELAGTLHNSTPALLSRSQNSQPGHYSCRGWVCQKTESKPIAELEGR